MIMLPENVDDTEGSLILLHEMKNWPYCLVGSHNENFTLPASGNLSANRPC